jgi:hypothetical protein
VLLAQLVQLVHKVLQVVDQQVPLELALAEQQVLPGQQVLLVQVLLAHKAYREQQVLLGKQDLQVQLVPVLLAHKVLQDLQVHLDQ